MTYHDIPTIEEVRTLAWLHDKERPCRSGITHRELRALMVAVEESRTRYADHLGYIARTHFFAKRYPCSADTLERAQDYTGDVNWVHLAIGMILHFSLTGDWLGGYRGIHLMQLCDDRVLAAIELAEPRLSFVM